MLDKIYIFKDKFTHPIRSAPHFNPTDVVLGQRLHLLEGSTSLTVVFPPWNIANAMKKPLEKQALKKGSSFLLYNFDNNMLTDDSEKVKIAFHTAANKSAEDIQQLIAKYGITEVNLIGISLGNITLMMTAAQLPFFNKVTLVVPGSDLAGAMWNGKRTQDLRRSYQSQGYTQDSLQKEWKELAPKAYAAVLKDHPVSIILGKKDIFIPFTWGLDMAKAVKSTANLSKVYICDLDHTRTIFKYIFLKHTFGPDKSESLDKY